MRDTRVSTKDGTVLCIISGHREALAWAREEATYRGETVAVEVWKIRGGQPDGWQLSEYVGPDRRSER